jgi:hypothetical protein
MSQQYVTSIMSLLEKNEAIHINLTSYFVILMPQIWRHLSQITQLASEKARCST